MEYVFVLKASNNYSSKLSKIAVVPSFMVPSVMPSSAVFISLKAISFKGLKPECA